MSIKNCITIEEAQDFVDGTMLPPREDHVAMHIAFCRNCEILVEQARQAPQETVTVEPKKRQFGIFSISMLILIILISACGGTPSPNQGSAKMLQQIPEVSEVGLQITIDPEGPISNPNGYEVGIQCSNGPSIPVYLKSKEEKSDLRGMCSNVVAWKSGE